MPNRNRLHRDLQSVLVNPIDTVRLDSSTLEARRYPGWSRWFIIVGFLLEGLIGSFLPTSDLLQGGLRLGLWGLLLGYLGLRLSVPGLLRQLRLRPTYWQRCRQRPLNSIGEVGLGVLIVVGLGLFTSWLSRGFVGFGFTFKTPLEQILVFPFLEEVLFRGLLQPAFFQIDKKRDRVLALILTSLVFTFCHSGQIVTLISLLPLLPILALSLVCGYLRNKHYSLWPGILIHVIYNAIASMVII